MPGDEISQSLRGDVRGATRRARSRTRRHDANKITGSDPCIFVPKLCMHACMHVIPLVPSCAYVRLLEDVACACACMCMCVHVHCATEAVHACVRELLRPVCMHVCGSSFGLQLGPLDLFHDAVARTWPHMAIETAHRDIAVPPLQCVYSDA